MSSRRIVSVLCTLGPSSLNRSAIERLQSRGVDLFRINLSHTPLERVAETIKTIQSFSSVPVCLDTEGAQVRTGTLTADVEVQDRQHVTLTRDPIIGNGQRFTLTPPSVFDNLKPNTLIGVDFDGVVLLVLQETEHGVDTVVLNGGRIGSNKAVTVDPAPLLPALSAKDVEAVRIGLEHRVKHFALSFANSADDVKQLRELVGPDATIISKIESKRGVRNIDAILAETDEILIDRGDLSREVPLENLPFLQKAIIRKAKIVKVPVNVATNLLESMIVNRKPTRAELNDIVNTMLDGANGLVLAAETAIGSHPVRTVDIVLGLIERYRRSLEGYRIATGFLALGVKDVNQRFKVRFIMDNVDEQIDTVSRSVLALTASCARCHDHKFDPIPARDYYALAGIFRSSELCAGVRSKMGGGGLDYYDPLALVRLGGEVKAAPPEKLAKAKKKLDKAQQEWNAIRGTPEGLAKGPDGRPKQRRFRVAFDQAQQEYLELTDPTLQGDAAVGVRDAKEITDTEYRIRGEAEALVPVVPRGYLSLVTVPNAPPIPADQSGHLELAQWLTSPDNSLASRVIVNRVWRHLFGRGIVSSVDNFGTTGDVPSHPELLDHLAARFVAEGRSIKQLIRTLVLTRTYRLDSSASPGNMAIDPSNRWLWRHAPRRLDAEELRDAMLAASGELQQNRPQGSPVTKLKVMELQNNSRPARSVEEAASESPHRSVYLPLVRTLTPTSLQVFDFAEQGMVSGNRDVTTVATQALYLLNDPFVRRHSLNLSKRVLSEESADEATQVNHVYRLVLGREATAAETTRAIEFLALYETALKANDGVERHLVAAATPPEANPNAASEGSQTGTTPSNGKDNDELPDPDQMVYADAPVKEESLGPIDPRTAAWMSFCQALFGSVECRYVK